MNNNQNHSTNSSWGGGLSIAGFVVAAASSLLGLQGLGGLVGLVLSIVGFSQDKQNGLKTGTAICGIVCSIGCLITALGQSMM